ncbi:hypothetical protein [Enterococcus sp. DIV0385]|uniref:hypothetical protein n=1 Tax=Enterococcus sp. DIV0385 TaxID=2775003 RepID=UPI000A334DEF|nr:hypothetical protein A5852_000284 [Enterococcus faecium]
MKIELNFPTNTSGLAGFPYGRSSYEKQVKDKYSDYNETLELVFPDHITDVASSFIQGFFSYLIEEVGYEGIEKNVVFKACSKDLEESMRARLY